MPNGFYPVGGANMITAHAVDSIKMLGGEVLVDAYVKEICFVNEKVYGVMVKDKPKNCFIRTMQVVSTTSILKTFNEFIPPYIARQSAMYPIASRVHSLEKIRLGAFQAYIGFSASQKELKFPRSNFFWLKNSNPYELDRYVSLPVADALRYGCPPMLFICFPSAKDPTWDKRHPGKSTCQLITVVNSKWFRAFKERNKTLKKRNAEDYYWLKDEIGKKLLVQLLCLFPGIEKHISFIDFSTPLSQQYYMQNCHGEMYSLTHAFHRFNIENWSGLRCTTDIPGLYLSGQDVLFCGISSALVSGFITAGAILKRDMFKDLEEACNKEDPQ